MVKRRVTADELIDALQSVIREKDDRKLVIDTKSGKKVVVEDIFIKDEASILILIEETYQKVINNLYNKESVLLSEIVKTADDLVSTFISLLHLVNDQKLSLSQETLYGEVYISTV